MLKNFILTKNVNLFHFKKRHIFLDHPVQSLQYQLDTVASTDVFLPETYREAGKESGILFGETFMCRDYGVERGTGGQGQGNVIGQKPVPVALPLSTPQIRRTQTSAVRGDRRGSREISGFRHNFGLLRSVE
jgi:hypothetical protein